MTVDFTIANHGSIFLLMPRTAAAKAWVAEHLPEDAATFGPSTVIEHRYIADIASGIVEDGLTIGKP